jgi:hypothetical protein
MRISSAAPSLLLLASCTAGANTAAQDGNLIDCAVGGAGVFAHDCSVERRIESGVLQLVIRHPGGGFRRFDVLEGGRRLEAADGAQRAASAAFEGGVEVAVGADRYRIPARLIDARR